MNIDDEVRALLQGCRVGVLVTLGEDGPLGSAMPFLPGESWTEALGHLSTLAAHTQNLLRDPRLSLFLMEADQPDKNPLALKRLNLQGTATPLDRQHATYTDQARRFTERFPEAAITMRLADFQLWQCRFVRALFIGGFGQAYRAEATAPGRWDHQRPRPLNGSTP